MVNKGCMVDTTNTQGVREGVVYAKFNRIEQFECASYVKLALIPLNT